MRISVAALLASIAVSSLAAAPPAAAQNETPVPVDKAPFHVPAFRNEFVAVTNVHIPPGRQAGYHIHDKDQISVIVGEADQAGQVLGEEAYPPRRTPRGNVSFTAFSKKTLIHRVHNMGATPFHNIVTSILYPAPGRFTAGLRPEGSGYTQLIDNERVRAWRLILEPGQSAASITQGAPGLRIVVDGGEIVESAPGQPDRGMAPKLGEFFWQESGATRAIRNTGTTRIQFIEYELK